MEHHPHHLLWVRQYGPKTSPQTAKNLATGEVCELADIPGGRLFSPISTADPVPAQELLVDGRGYSSLPCWPELSGRFSAQVTIPEDSFGEADYTEIIQAVRTAAERSAQNIAVIKIVAKDKVAPPAHLRIGPGVTDEDVQQLINRAFDDFWIVYRYTGITDAFLVQAHVQMEFEYRFFIVDGVPVTGAACIEEHTPLDNAGHPFDAKVRQHRLARTPVHDAPAGLIDGVLLPFARGAASRIAEALPAARAYALDVAVDGVAGRPVLIELNSLLNAGLYASQPERLFAALTAGDSFPRWQEGGQVYGRC